MGGERERERERERELNMAELHIQGWRTNLRWNLFSVSCSDRNLPEYMISRKFAWSYLQPAAYTEHLIIIPSDMPPTQFSPHFCREHQRRIYFWYLVYFLVIFFPMFDFRSCIDRCQSALHSISNNYRCIYLDAHRLLHLWCFFIAYQHL